jgi:predicted MPP superfamily phosphohydrolase
VLGRQRAPFAFSGCSINTTLYLKHITRGFMITRRRFLRASAVAAGLGVGVGLYTWRWEPHWLEVVERPLRVANLPERLVGARLAQLSDLHIGPQVDDSYLVRAFKQVTDLAPEIVVYTGDFTSYEADIFAHARRVFTP